MIASIDCMERNFDELNYYENEKLNILSYFDSMELTEEEKEERKQFSKEMQDILLFIFTLFAVMKEYQSINKQYIVNQLQSKYLEVVLKYMELDKYIEDYIAEFSQETVETTLKNIDEEFYLSVDRSLLISVNEANTTLNYKDYANAIKEGKTRKQWVTEKDKKVRKTHRELDDVVIPIEDTFVVGDTLMRFPHDTLYGVDYEQLSNCRCSIKYF